MKLDHRRTILGGLAFLSICAFWQMYDSVIPKILTETFRLNETLSGAIMALDNILALFLLPLFGALSDRTSTKIGRRMPFILLGTACAAVLMNLLPVLDNRYAAAPSTGKLVGFAAVLGLLLVAMGTYRSPAVALMPDVTPNPLRSRANAIINLMGAIGGIIYLAVAAVMYPNAKIAGLAHVNYQPLFLVVSAVMLVSVAVLFLTVKEPKLAAETRALEAQHPEWDLTEDDGSGKEVLPKPVKRSLGFLLVSIALWYIGYNGVTTWWSTYVGAVMGQGLGGASTCLLIATAGAVVLAHRPQKDHSLRLRPARRDVPDLLLPHHALLDHSSRHVRLLCPRGLCLGGHQRQLAPDGAGDVPRQRHRQIHRLLLYLLHGGAGRHAGACRYADASYQLPRALPLRGALRRRVLCHDVLRAPRRFQSRGQERPGCL